MLSTCGVKESAVRQADETIGRRIAQARREAGMTQDQLAEALGVTKRSVQGYEAGKVIPYRYLDGLTQATGKSREWLLRGDSDEPVSALGEVGERLVALVEQIAEEAERIAGVASRLESRLDERSSPPGSRARA
jgi:transcriptional regulator with XRE-family HTH domain